MRASGSPTASSTRRARSEAAAAANPDPRWTPGVGGLRSIPARVRGPAKCSHSTSLSRKCQAAPGVLEREQAVPPREAFFAEAEHVPGEVITAEVLDRLRSGVGHGFLISDSADPALKTLRVVARP